MLSLIKLLQRNLSTRYCTLCFLFEIMYKNNDFWLLKHFRHSWNENNFRFASLIFFSVTPSHRSGPNSSWTSFEMLIDLPPGPSSQSSTHWRPEDDTVRVCLTVRFNNVCRHGLLYYYFLLPCPQFGRGHQPSYSWICPLLPKVTCTVFNVFISSCIYWESNSWPQCLSYIYHLI